MAKMAIVLDRTESGIEFISQFDYSGNLPEDPSTEETLSAIAKSYSFASNHGIEGGNVIVLVDEKICYSVESDGEFLQYIKLPEHYFDDLKEMSF